MLVEPARLRVGPHVVEHNVYDQTHAAAVQRSGQAHQVLLAISAEISA